MDLLISVDEYVALRDVSKKLDRRKIEEAIKLAQIGDFKRMLGIVYFKLLANKDEPEYINILDEKEFEYKDVQHMHLGLKAVLADLTHARFVKGINIHLNPFGATSKVARDGEKVSHSNLRDLSKQAQQDASDKFCDIKLFMDESDFDYYGSYCENEYKSGAFKSNRIDII